MIALILACLRSEEILPPEEDRRRLDSQLDHLDYPTRPRGGPHDE